MNLFTITLTLFGAGVVLALPLVDYLFRLLEVWDDWLDSQDDPQR